MNILNSIVELIGALSVLIGAILAIEKWTRGKLSSRLLKPVFTRLDNIDDRLLKMDKNQCMNYLTEFLADVRNGTHKTEYQKARAHDVYKHYSEDLKGNSYIHEQWEMYMIGKEN